MLLAAGVVVLGLGAGLLAGFTGHEGSSLEPPQSSSSTWPDFELPLALEPSTLSLAQQRRDLLVGLAAREGGPVEVAALRAQTPFVTDDVKIAVDGDSAETESCGRGCSRFDAPVLEGRPSRVSVEAGGETFSFALPGSLPPSGQATFDQALKRMDSLRAYRFTEDLSSGRSTVVTKLEVQAPDRMRLRTSNGYRSVIIGKTRWDYDGRWQRGPFPGLNVGDIVMWHSAKHPRELHGGPTTELAAFALEPVPSWFRIKVRSGRVVEAQMLAPSHFMTHHYSGFNAPIRIEPPR
jgi:hypothetical protein